MTQPARRQASHAGQARHAAGYAGRAAPASRSGPRIGRATRGVTVSSFNARAAWPGWLTRLVRLHLTPRALSVREPVRDARAALEQHATGHLTAAELDHLRSSLMKIIAQLRDEPS